MDKFGTQNKQKTIIDIEVGEVTQSIRLPFFLTTLAFSPITNKGEASEVFSRLLDNGLPLHFTHSTNISCDECVNQLEVKQALERIDEALFETDIPRDQLFEREKLITSTGNTVSMAELEIYRTDVIEVFAQLGFEQFPWVKVPWPYAETDVYDAPIAGGTKYLSFFATHQLLEKRLNTPVSEEEFWMWCFFGKKLGGIDAYLFDGFNKYIVHNAGLAFPTHINDSGHGEYRIDDLKRQLKHWRFLNEEIEQFIPKSRYITGQQLLERWAKQLGDENEAKNRIKEYGMRFGCEPMPNQRPYLYNQFPAETENWNPIEQGVFLLEDVRTIETYDRMSIVVSGLKTESNKEAEDATEYAIAFDLYARKNELENEEARIKRAYYSDEARRSIDLEKIRSELFSIEKQLKEIDHENPIEPEPETEAKLNFDDELDSILDAGVHDGFNVLKQRNEAPYDGVLGCPPDSVTENEKERFESIRNRLLDEEDFTVADIVRLINDCEANTHSFSLIPDRLKQDIRFLASLWRAAKQDKPKVKVIEDGVLGSKENTNDFYALSLLKLPSRQDAWVDVIADMATAFNAKFNRLPNESQAWGQLWENPPDGYVLTTGKDRGEDCLNMPGENPLSKSGFSRRWKNYTEK